MTEKLQYIPQNPAQTHIEGSVTKEQFFSSGETLSDWEKRSSKILKDQGSLNYSPQATLGPVRIWHTLTVLLLSLSLNFSPQS